MVAILSSDVLPEIRLTVDEYLQADLPEGQRYELVDGVVEMTPIPGGQHDESLSSLLDAVCAFRAADPQAIRHLSVRAGIAVPDRATIREPDLALYQQWATQGSGSEVWRRFTPFWVAEIVSPGQHRRDYEDKHRDYWLAGVQEYWIIDRDARQVAVLVRGDQDWNETVFHAADTACSQRLAGFAVPVSRLIGSV